MCVFSFSDSVSSSFTIGFFPESVDQFWFLSAKEDGIFSYTNNNNANKLLQSTLNFYEFFAKNYSERKYIISICNH